MSGETAIQYTKIFTFIKNKIIKLGLFWYGTIVSAWCRVDSPNSIQWTESDTQEIIRMILAYGTWVGKKRLLYTSKSSVFNKLSGTVFKIQSSIPMPYQPQYTTTAALRMFTSPKDDCPFLLMDKVKSNEHQYFARTIHYIVQVARTCHLV